MTFQGVVMDFFLEPHNADKINIKLLVSLIWKWIYQKGKVTSGIREPIGTLSLMFMGNKMATGRNVP